MVSQGARQRLNSAIVEVKLVLTHPVGYVVGCRHRTGADDGDVVCILLQAKDVRGAQELQGIET